MHDTGILLPARDTITPAVPSAQRTVAFYAWEARGRGWQLYDYPVGIEPRYVPFNPEAGMTAQVVDDARTPSLLGQLLDRAAARFRRPPTLTDTNHAAQGLKQGAPVPVRLRGTDEVRELQITLPEKVKITPGQAEQLLLSLSRCAAPVSFEVVGRASGVTIQVAAHGPDLRSVYAQVQAYFPEASVLEVPGFLARHWAGGTARVVVDFGLAREFMLPLSVCTSFEPDPLTGFIGALTRLRAGDIGIFQVIFQSTRHPWAESIMRAVTDGEGKSFFLDAPDLLPRTRDKVSRPLFAAVVRVAARSDSAERAWRIAKGLGGALAQFANPAGNELIALSNDNYDAQAHAACVTSRQSHRWGMLLNSEELASLVHLPSASVRAEKLQRLTKRTKAAPAIALGHELVLGENTHRGKTTTVTLSPEQRTKHMLISGVTGSGKSTLLLNMIRQDALHGHGLCVLDPHGDLIDQAISFIPDARLNDVILFDPADAEFPIGFNILAAKTELERNLLASDLVAVFKRLSTAWGDQMNSVLANGILAFLESTTGGTLIDLRRFLIEREYRSEFLQTVTDPEVVYYWQREFPLLPGRPQAPLLTRLDTFLRLKLIRHMVAQREMRLDFRRIMDERKILLIRLSQGAMGEENAHLLGALVVAKLHQAALSRQELSEDARSYFFLYIDEFQNFITPSMSAILSGARKYHLGLVLAHQEFRQLWSQDTEVASAVITNPYTRVCFRLGDFDARRLAKGFASFAPEQLQNLSVGEAVVRVERNEYDFNLAAFPLPRVADEVARQRHAAVLEIARTRYARPCAEVEAELAAKRAAQLAAPPVSAPPQVLRRKSVSARTSEVPLPHKVAAGASPLAQKTAQTANTERAAQPRSEPLELGRGGRQHKYLQQLVKRMAEANGFRATIEQQVLGGAGSIDVALEKDARKIACEISVTSTEEYELNNIQKCLAAGYEPVILLATDKRALSKVERLAQAQLSAEISDKVLFFQPEELLAYLDALTAASGEQAETVKGYKVKVKYKAVEGADQHARKQAISQVIMQALHRMKKSE